jgi:hypothetical protein
MKSINAPVLMIVLCGFLASACDRSEESKPAPAAGAAAAAADATPQAVSRPASQPSQEANMSDSDVVQWRLRCDLDDGRRLISDGSMLVETQYFPNVPVPEKSVPAAAAQRLLQSETDHEFGLNDLKQKTGGGPYVSPRGVQLNRKYIKCLRESALNATLRFRAKGANDPVLLLDREKVVGVVMPIKT